MYCSAFSWYDYRETKATIYRLTRDIKASLATTGLTDKLFSDLRATSRYITMMENKRFPAARHYIQCLAVGEKISVLEQIVLERGLPETLASDSETIRTWLLDRAANEEIDILQMKRDFLDLMIEIESKPMPHPKTYCQIFSRTIQNWTSWAQDRTM